MSRPVGTRPFRHIFLGGLTSGAARPIGRDMSSSEALVALRRQVALARL